MIKGIIFDLDGVYFKNGTKNFLDAVSFHYGINRDHVAHVYFKSEQMQCYKRGEISGEEYWTWALTELGIQAFPQELLSLLAQGYEVNTQAVQLLHRVREKGIKTIICSNNFKERIDVLEQRFHFQNDFDYVILSYAYGIIKPQLLDSVIEKTKFKAEEILVIDDGKTIISEAQKKGFQTIFCENPDHLENYLQQFRL